MIRAYVANQAQFEAHLDARGEAIIDGFGMGIGRLTLRLQRMVKTDKLRGQVLHWRTGRLNNSIMQRVLTESRKFIGVVSTNVFYGVGWELGWPGRQAFEGTLAQAKERFRVASSTTFMNGTPKQRSFLASALLDLQKSGVIGTELRAATGEGIAT